MPAEGLSLELTRPLPAPRARAFEFFGDAGMLAKWWGPRGFGIPSTDFVPRVGRTYRIVMKPPQGDAFELRGTFREVDPPSRLAFTFEWDPPDADDQETLAQVALEVSGDSTSLRLRQGPFRTEARCALHRDGWEESLDKLVELLGAET